MLSANYTENGDMIIIAPTGGHEMTNREKKAELLKYRSAIQEVSRIEQDIMRWRSQAEKMTSSFHLTPSGGGNNRSIENAVEQIDALNLQLVEKRKEVNRLRIYLSGAISSVPDEKLKKLLRLRYIDGITWEKIAEEMGFSYQWICKLHGKALSKIFTDS